MTDPFFQNQNPQQTPQNPAQAGQIPAAQQIPQGAQMPPQMQAQPQTTPEQQLQAIQAQQAAMQRAQMEQQLQAINQQEQVVRQQLQQLNTVWQNPQLTPEQRQQIQLQGQQLNQQLAAIMQQKQQISGQLNKSVQKPKVKKGSKVSMKGFLVGCGIFLMILLGLGGLVFFSFVQDPDKIASMGMTMDSAKQLLQAFVSIFFGLLVFAGFGMLVVNVYRLFTVKNKKKIGFVGGTFLGIVVLIAAGAGWVGALNKIGTISGGTSVNTQDMIMRYVQLKDGPQLLQADTALIAPASTLYMLNGQVFNTQVLSQIGTIDTNQLSVNLLCGNGQSLSLNLSNLQFEGSCLFAEKGDFPQTLEVNYVNPQTQEKLQELVSAGTITFASAINITSSNEIEVRDTEIDLGKAPSKVTFDATDIFSDFGLSNYVITWDVDDDGVIDRENDSSFSYIYKKAQVYNVNFRIPALNDLAYTFPVRINPSDVPICEISSTATNGSEYNIQVDFIENNEVITDYIYSIIDITNNNKEIDIIKSTNSTINYQFPGKGVYAIATTFQTDEGKKGSCESPNIEIWTSDFDISYSLQYKTPSDPNFVNMPNEGDINFQNNTVTINEIPTILKVSLDNITPQTATMTKKVFLDDEPKLSLDDNNFELSLTENKTYQVRIVIEDSNRDMKSEETFSVEIKRDDIVGKLLVKPDTVGTDPFTVTFDASTTVVNDPDDEIVYFTWDFGDGETKNDISQSVISHTYTYDYEKEAGNYYPTVTLSTKKGREITVSTDSPIIVKKEVKTFEINVDSHPSQQAKIGDTVQFSLDLDSLPTKIYWDFGDGNTLECKERECVETNKIYLEAGTYKIKVQIVDDKAPMSESSITLKVVD